MRIVPDNCPSITIDSGIIYGKHFAGKPIAFYGEQDTIEITDEEWQSIMECYILNTRVGGKLFAQYLRELIELKRGN